MKEPFKEDKHLNELMGDDLDIEQSWEELNRKRKRRVFPFWLFGVLFCGGVGLCLLYHSGAERMDRFIAEDIEKIQEAPLTTSDNLAIESEDKLTTEFIITVQQSTISNATNLTAKEKESLLSNANQSIVEPAIIIKKNKTNDNILESTIIPEIVVNNPAGIGQKNGTINALKSTASGGLVFYYSINNNATKDLKDKQNLSIFQVPPISKPLSDKKKYLNIPSIESKIGSLVIPTVDLPKLSFVPTPKNPEQNKKLWLQLNYSLGLVKRDIKNHFSSQYTDLRNTEEQFLESQHIGININKKIYKHLYLGIGLDFSQHRSQLVKVVQEIRPVVYEGVVTRYLVTQNSRTPVIGSVTGSEVTITEQIRYQQYRDLRLPIRAGIRKSFARNFIVDYSLGVGMLLNGNTIGSTFDPTNPLDAFIPLDELGYKKNLHLNYFSTLAVNHQITPTTTIGLGIQYTADFHSRLKENGREVRNYPAINLNITYSLEK